MKQITIFCFLLIITSFCIAQQEKKKKKHYESHNFTIGVSTEVLNYIKTNNPYYYNKPVYLHVNCGYRLFKNTLISPEVSLGLIYIDTKEQFTAYIDEYRRNTFYYWRQKEYNTYLRAGLDLQTKRKAAFLFNTGFFMPITLTAIGFSARTGIKYNISPKLGISLCPEMIICIGNIPATYQKYGVIIDNVPLYSDTTIKGLFYTTRNRFVYCMKLGINF